jgi:hypothetical protein
MTFGLASWGMQGLCGDIKLSSNYRPPFYAKIVVTTSLLCPKNECQRRLALHLGKFKGCAATLTQNRTSSLLSWQKYIPLDHNHVAN